MLKDMDFHVAAFHAPSSAFQAPSGGGGVPPAFQEPSGPAVTAGPARSARPPAPGVAAAPPAAAEQATAMDVDTLDVGPARSVTGLVIGAGGQQGAPADFGAAAAPAAAATLGTGQPQEKTSRQTPAAAAAATPPPPLAAAAAEAAAAAVAEAAAAAVRLECPVCGQQVGGEATGNTAAMDAELMLQRHVEGHFQEAAPQQTAQVGGGGFGGGAGVRRPILVECPICGDGFHSERDVSRHMDEVH